MNFAEYLQNRQLHQNLTTAAEHYRKLGGKKKLGISVRHFQQISSGMRPPTEHLLSAIFDQVDVNDRRTITTAFFKSVLRGQKEGKLLIEYIENHLTPAIEGTTSSVWDKSKSVTFLNEEQMEFFISQPAALRCYQKVILLDQAKRDEVNLSQSNLEMMLKLGLVAIKNNVITPTNRLFRIPTFENSGASLVRMGSELIEKILGLYVSKEGNPKQEVHLRIQLVTRSAAERISEQFKNLNKWIQSLANDSDPSGPDLVPLIFYGVTKVMEKKDL